VTHRTPTEKESIKSSTTLGREATVEFNYHRKSINLFIFLKVR
jgi:hypothetical protein